jgi:hypothetical protein
MKRSRRCRAALAAGLLVLCLGDARAQTGAAYDHAALQAMIDAAGDGGLVYFAPGTYTICHRLVPRNGQVWELEGATLRLCDALLSPLTAPAGSGATHVDVEDASVFELGQRISPIKGRGGDDGEQGELHVIVAIDGNRVHFTNPLIQDYAAGDALLVVEAIVETTILPGPRAWVLRGGTIDGNRRGNPHHVAWELGTGILASGHGVTISGVTFLDCWGSCIHAGSLFDSEIRDSVFDTGASAAIHLSNTRNLLIQGSAFSNFNADAALARHSEGTITWSNLNQDVVVDRVCIEDMQAPQVAALGYTLFSRNRGVEIKDSQFCRVPAIWAGGLLLAPLGDYLATGDVSIHGNFAVDAGHSLMHVDPEYAAHFSGFSFRDNVLIDTTYDWSAVPGAVIEGNQLDSGPEQCSCLDWVVSGGIQDPEGDGWPHAADNCRWTPNPGQENRDGDRYGDACDRCPDYASDDNADLDGNGIGNVCECGDQTLDAVVDVRDLVEIKQVIFGRATASPLCDTDDDGRCTVSDIVGANGRIFRHPAYCARYPRPAR